MHAYDRMLLYSVRKQSNCLYDRLYVHVQCASTLVENLSIRIVD